MKPPAIPTDRARVELAAQHTVLRGMMDRCEELADEIDAGRMGPLQLAREVARLRIAFDAHNRFEEQLLRPVLLDADGPASAHVDRMCEEHVDQHRAIRGQLASSTTSDLRAVIADLRAHLDAEERYFVAPGPVAEDDVELARGAG